MFQLLDVISGEFYKYKEVKMQTTYPYTKEVNTTALAKEINASSIVIGLDAINLKGTALSIIFKAELSPSEVTTLDALVDAHVIEANPPEVPQVEIVGQAKTTQGLPKFSMYEAEGGAATIISHGFNDKCSWYMGSVQVIKGPMSNTELVYSDPNSKTHFIDLEHGRLYDEDNIMLQTSNKYKVKVYVDDVEVLSGFTIDYVLGNITFDEAPTGVVTASYHYADKSWYCLRPKSGKVMSIKAAEVQFSSDAQINSPLVFSPWFVDHPSYGTMEIPGQQIKYKNAKDFISACNEGQGLIPAWGELTKDVHVFPFQYARPKPVKHSDYIEIRIYCEDHNAVTGEFATATFYVVIDDEAVTV